MIWQHAFGPEKYSNQQPTSLFSNSILFDFPVIFIFNVFPAVFFVDLLSGH